MSRVHASTMVSAASRIASRVIAGKAVVIVIDEQKLHTLNEVGTFVFEQLDDSPKSVEELVAATVAEFNVEAETAYSDVSGFVAQLAELGALELSDQLETT